MHRLLPAMLASLGLALPGSAAALSATARPSPSKPAVSGTAEPLPGIAHWRCWQSFDTVQGFDECDGSAVIHLDGLPDGTRRVRMHCIHELHYLTARPLEGSTARLDAHDRSARSMQTVEVHGRQAYVSLGSHIVLPVAGATPFHYWNGAVRCTIVGTRP